MIPLFIKSFVSFLVIINPLSIVPVFIDLTSRETLDEQRKIAIRGTSIALIIIMAFAVLGNWLLIQLEISSSALLVAGGILLMIFAIRRVLGGNSGRMPTEDEKTEAQYRRDLHVFPVAIPLIAGPGALTVVMFKMQEASDDIFNQLILVAALFFVLTINGCILYFANGVSRALGVTGTNVVTRVFGIILAAIAAQLILKGVVGFLVTCQVLP